MKPILWGGFPIGASSAEVYESIPESVKVLDGLRFSAALFDCEFEAALKFDDYGLSKVTLTLARPLVTLRFADLRDQMVSALMEKHGRGLKRHWSGDLYMKRWREPYVNIDFLAVDSPTLPTVSVEYSKIAITDAVIRYL